MEHLTPMTDFVLEQEKYVGIKKAFVINNLFYNYAKFLKKELKLGYFVPCDFNDVPLEEPKHYDLWKKYGSFTQYGESIVSECNKFHEAKNRVLFEEFEVVQKSNFISFEKEGIILFNYNKNRNCFVCNYVRNIDSVENLLRFNLKLTETAKKEIGLI